MALPLLQTDVTNERYHRTLLATTTNELIKLRQPNDTTEAEDAAQVKPSDVRYPPGDVRRYGAVGDGSTDDSAAIRRAVSVMEVGGGTVIFPSDKGYKWAIGSQVTVSSLYPVNLIGNMSSNPNATEESTYIKPLNNISGDLFRYESPTASPNEGGGGTIRGLSFFDDSDPENATIDSRRVFTMDAALGLDSFALSKIENCYFHNIRGSAIRAGFVVMSDFVGCVIRYCGATGLPAFDHPSDASYVMQSCSVSRCRLEVCFDAAYIYLHNNTNTKENKLSALGFESDDSIAAASSSYFIDCAASSNIISHCHFDRIGATYAVRLSGQMNEIVAAQAELNAGGFATLTGNKNTITGGKIIAATSTIATIDISGQDGTVNGTTLYFANKIAITGTRAQVVDAKLIDCTSADYLITATASGFDISHVVIQNTNSVRAVSPSGISVSNEGKVAFCRLSGNSAATGINVNSANVQCVYNTLAGGHTTDIAPNGHMADSWIERNIGFVTEATGQATVAAGDTSVIVSHGLDFDPTLQNVRCAPLQNWGSSTKWWVHDATATQLEIRVDPAPGGSGLVFGWSIAPR